MSSVTAIALRRTAAERQLADAKETADRLRVEHIQAVIAEAFPTHDRVVFKRDWDEDDVRLLKVVGSESEPDFEYPGMTFVLGRPSAQIEACDVANIAAISIGDDDDLSRFLEFADSGDLGEDEGRYYFTLSLRDPIKG